MYLFTWTAGNTSLGARVFQEFVLVSNVTLGPVCVVAYIAAY